MRPTRVGRLILWGGLSIAAGLFTQPQVRAQAAALSVDTKAADTKAAPLDTNTCFTCHEAVFTKDFTKSHHAGLENACANCHKGAAEHAQAMQAGDRQARRSPPSRSSARGRSTRPAWAATRRATRPTGRGGTHDRRDLACTSCHSVHDVQVRRGPAQDRPRARDLLHVPPRDPGQEPAHLAPSGARGADDLRELPQPPRLARRPKMIKADWTNELCLECHTEKRGPFLWEHAPVRENCLNCHDPHGSNHDKMLVSQQPWLCQRCHLNTRHPGHASTATSTPAAPVDSPATARSEHACKNCHQNVHGGNAPTAPYLGR